MNYLFEFVKQKYASFVVAIFLVLSIIFLGFSIHKLYYYLLLQIDDKSSILSAERQILSNFAAGVFLIIWWYINKRIKQNDFSLLFFSLAMLAWGMPRTDIDDWKLEFSLLYSTLNNIFFYCSFRDLEYGSPNFNHYFFKFIGINKNNYFKAILLIGLGILTIIFVLVWLNLEWIAQFVDIFVSVLMFIWLLIALSKAFNNRLKFWTGKAMIAFTTFILIAAIFSQVLTATVLYYEANDPEIKGYDYLKTLSSVFAAVYNINLIFLIGALAFSWAYEKLMKQLEMQSQRDGFLRQEMIHIVRNSIDFFKYDLEDLKNLEYSKANPDEEKLEFYNENIIRFFLVGEVFREIHRLKSTQGIHLNSYLKSILDNICKTFNFRYINYNDINLDTLNFVPEPSAQKIAKIIIELFMNAYKYGDKWAELSVNIIGDFINIVIKDQGKDFNEINKGFGSKVIEEYLIKDLKGTYQLTTSQTGSNIEIKIPLAKFIIYEDSNFG